VWTIKKGELICEGSRGGEKAIGRRFAIGVDLPGQVAMHGLLANMRSSLVDSRFDPNSDAQMEQKTLTALAVPVKDIRGQTICVIEARNKRRKRDRAILVFGDEDEESLKSLAMSASAALMKARKREQTKAKLGKEEPINEKEEKDKEKPGFDSSKDVEKGKSLFNPFRLTTSTLEQLPSNSLTKSPSK